MPRKVTVFDLARDDMAEAVEDAFRYGKLVLASVTYNADIFPFMKFYIDHLTEEKLSEPYNRSDREWKLGTECSKGYGF